MSAIEIEAIALPNGRTASVYHIAESRIGAALVLGTTYLDLPIVVADIIAREVPREDRRRMSDRDFRRYLALATMHGMEHAIGYVQNQMADD